MIEVHNMIFLAEFIIVIYFENYHFTIFIIRKSIINEVDS